LLLDKQKEWVPVLFKTKQKIKLTLV
jgi:hypothetical protein